MLRFGPEIRALLGAVDAPQPDLLSPTLVEDGDAVAVDDTDNLPGPGSGSRRQQEQGERQEPRKKVLIWFPSLLSCHRLGSSYAPAILPSRSGKCAPRAGLLLESYQVVAHR